MQKFKINSLDNEKNLVNAFDVELRVGFDPVGVNNPSCPLTTIAAGLHTCDLGLNGVFLTIRAHQTFFEMFKISIFSNSQIEIDLKNEKKFKILLFEKSYSQNFDQDNTIERQKRPANEK